MATERCPIVATRRVRRQSSRLTKKWTEFLREPFNDGPANPVGLGHSYRSAIEN